MAVSTHSNMVNRSYWLFDREKLTWYDKRYCAKYESGYKPALEVHHVTREPRGVTGLEPG